MSSITFDTLKFAERLEKAGLTREQAAAIVETQKDAMSEAMDTTLATKADINDLKGELKSEIASVRSEINTIKWMMGVLIAIAIANFAKQFF